MRYLLIVLLGWLPMLAGAVELIRETTQSLPWAEVMQVFEDPRARRRWRRQRQPGPVQAPHKATLNAGYSRSVFWLKIDLQYRPTTPRRNAPGCWSWRIRRWTPRPLLADAAGNYRLQRTGAALRQPQIQENNYLFS
jgi:hypothetical protein